MEKLTSQGVFLRFIFAFILVLLTYNPSGYSYFHWLKQTLPGITPLVALCGVGLIIGWAIYVRATLRSLGPFGLTLAAIFFACVIWLLIDIGVLSLANMSALAWVVLVIITGLLTTGMCWSHIRRRMSGQADMDDVDED